MDEQQLLSRLRRGDEQALAAVIARFSAYVVTVIHNRSRGLLSPEDEDELASSTFFALWQSCRTVKAESIRAVADLTDYKESTGQFMPNVKIIVDGFTDVGAIGQNTISIEIRKA